MNVLDNKTNHMKPLSRRETILHLLKKPEKKMSCQQICKYIIKKESLTDNVARYLSGSISSKLAKLVKDGVLKYADEKSIKGGHLYQVK